MSDVQDIARSAGKVIELRPASDESRGLSVSVIKLPFGILYAPGFEENGNTKAQSEPESEARKDAEDNKDEEAPEKNYFSKLWPAYLCVFVDFLGLGIAIPILPYLALELGGTAFDVGALGGVFSVGQLIGNFVMGRVSDSCGRKPVVIASLFCSSLGYAFCGLVPTLQWLYAARVFSGIAGGTIPVVQAMIIDIVDDPKMRPKYFGLCGASLGMAFLFGPALGALFTSTIGSRAAFFVSTGIALVANTLALCYLDETNPKVIKAAEREDLKKLTSNDEAEQEPKVKEQQNFLQEVLTFPSQVFAVCAASFMQTYSFSNMTSTTALIWIRLFNWGGRELGIFLTVAGVVQTIVQLGLVKKICDTIGNERTLMLGAGLAAIGITSFSFISNPYLHIAVHLLFIGVGQGVQTPVLPSILSGYVTPDKRGLATGLQASFNSLGLCTAPFIAGALFDTNVGFLWGQFEFGSYSHFGFLFAGLANILAIVIIYVAIGIGGDDEKNALEQQRKKKEVELASV